MKKLQLGNSAGYDTVKGWKTRFTLDFGEDTFFVTLLIFGVEQGIGANTLSRYFKMLRLDTHIGVSPTPIQTKLSQLQDAIIRFQKEVE